MSAPSVRQALEQCHRSMQAVLRPADRRPDDSSRDLQALWDAMQVAAEALSEPGDTARLSVLHLPGDAPDAFVLVVSNWRGEAFTPAAFDGAKERTGARTVLVFDRPVEID